MLSATMLLVGAVLIAMVLIEGPVKRLPLSAAIVYLGVGWAAALLGLPLLRVDLVRHAPLLTVLSEWAVLISLFAVGLRLGKPAARRGWRVAAQLAGSGMVLTVVLAAAAAHVLLGLSWPAAILLGAILAPTDPVLASDVQIRSERDRDAVRLSLTAEGGLNDGSAFPIVILGLGLLQLPAAGDAPRLTGSAFLTDWLLYDLLWLVGGGLALGIACGWLIGLALRHRLRRDHGLAWDELLYLGTIALSYGLATALHASAFLAVFAAGATLFHEREVKERVAAVTTAPEGGDLSARLHAFGARCERLVEVSMVLLIGVTLAAVEWRWQLLAYALVLVAVVRPLAVYAVVRGDNVAHSSALPPTQRRLVAWFGIRGVGSFFYLVYALQHRLPQPLAQQLIDASLVAIALSIVLHGVSATPLMNRYHRQRPA
jgi:NhaP-type Na+/H+ or K+/H+ antiporter